MAPRQDKNPITHQLKQFKETHYGFLLSAYFTIGLLIFFIVGLFLDSRTITGAPAWLKPTKFAISISIYSFTLLWFLSLIDTSKRWRKRLVNIIGWTLTLTFLAEWVGIITQAARGTRSHFNVSSPFDTAIWSLMAVAIFILFIANIGVVVLLLTQPFKSSVLAWALKLAMIIAVIGLAQGYLMTDPTAQQMAGWRSGEAITVIGAHSVGVEDGGTGLPFLNWSTEAGDLRIGHFVGMHALQVIPFLALLIMRQQKLRENQKNNLVFIASGSYLAITLLLTWQALRAQPITQPDALTISMFVIIALVSVLLSILNLIPSKKALNSQNPLL